MSQVGTIEHAAAIAGLSYDEAATLQMAHSRLLAAAARGSIDLNALARQELANRGLDQAGKWVGFAKAADLAAGLR